MFDQLSLQDMSNLSMCCRQLKAAVDPHLWAKIAIQVDYDLATHSVKAENFMNVLIAEEDRCQSIDFIREILIFSKYDLRQQSWSPPDELKLGQQVQRLVEITGALRAFKLVPYLLSI